MATIPATPDAKSCLTKEAAVNTLLERVYAPEFFKKLASLGVEPANAVEGQQLLELAAVLRSRGYSAATQKTAATQPQGNSWLAQLIQKEASLVPIDVKQAAMACLQHDPQLLAAVQVIDESSAAA